MTAVGDSDSVSPHNDRDERVYQVDSDDLRVHDNLSHSYSETPNLGRQNIASQPSADGSDDFPSFGWISIEFCTILLPTLKNNRTC